MRGHQVQVCVACLYVFFIVNGGVIDSAFEGAGRRYLLATAQTVQNHTTPPRDTKPRQCEVCSGPIQICEHLYRTETCHYPDNLCMNHIINYDSGTRTVERKCSNRQVCYREWYLGSSDNDRCQTFDETNIYTLGFECHYCCTEDGCNIPLHPAKNTLM